MLTKTLSKKSPYYLDRERLLAAVHYCRCYPIWKRQYNSIDGWHSIIMDDLPHGTDVGAPTERDALKRSEIKDKMEIVEKACKNAGEEIYMWLLLGVTEGLPFYNLELKGIPCGKDMYYDRRRKVYFLVANAVC